MSKKSSKYQETSSIANNFSKYSLIFAFSIILAENKYIFTYLIRISIKITQNKYTYQKKVSRRNPDYNKIKLVHIIYLEVASSCYSHSIKFDVGKLATGVSSSTTATVVDLSLFGLLSAGAFSS